MKKSFLLLIFLFALLLAACNPESTSGRDDAQIYAAAIRQQYGPDDTFGGSLQAPTIYLVRQTDDGIGDPDIAQGPGVTLSPELQADISAALAGLPADIIWVDSSEEVETNPDTGEVAGGGVIIQVGNIHEGEDNYEIDFKIGSDIVYAATRVLDQSNRPVEGVTVSAVWTFPDGSTMKLEGQTNSKGFVIFTVEKSGGEHKLEFVDVQLGDVPFNADASQLVGTVVVPE